MSMLRYINDFKGEIIWFSLRILELCMIYMILAVRAVGKSIILISSMNFKRLLASSKFYILNLLPCEETKIPDLIKARVSSKRKMKRIIDNAVF